MYLLQILQILSNSSFEKTIPVGLWGEQNSNTFALLHKSSNFSKLRENEFSSLSKKRGRIFRLWYSAMFTKGL